MPAQRTAAPAPERSQAGTRAAAPAMQREAAREPGPQLAGPEPTLDEKLQRARRLGHDVTRGGVDLVQRKVGYEYELGDVATYKETSAGLFGGKQQSRLPKFAPVAPPRRGFKVEAEDPPTGSTVGTLSSLELVTAPEIDDNADDGRDQAAIRLTYMANFVKQLAAIADNGVVPASTLGGAADVFFGNISEMALEKGRLQATIGLSLDALTRVRSGEAAAEASKEGLKPNASEARRNEAFYTQGAASGSAPRIWAASYEAVKQWARIPPRGKELLEGDQRILATIVSMIVQIPIGAWNAYRQHAPVPYPKSAAGTLLARTSFAGMLLNAPTAVQLTVAENPGWTNFLLGVVNGFLAGQAQAIADGADEVFVPPTPLTAGDLVLPGTEIELTLGKWFGDLALIIPIDRLTQKDYPSNLPEGQGKELESLGGFGTKTDEGPKNEPRPIVEFRGLPYVDPDHVVDAGLAIWDYAKRAGNQ